MIRMKGVKPKKGQCLCTEGSPLGRGVLIIPEGVGCACGEKEYHQHCAVCGKFLSQEAYVEDDDRPYRGKTYRRIKT